MGRNQKSKSHPALFGYGDSLDEDVSWGRISPEARTVAAFRKDKGEAFALRLLPSDQDVKFSAPAPCLCVYSQASHHENKGLIF